MTYPKLIKWLKRVDTPTFLDKIRSKKTTVAEILLKAPTESTSVRAAILDMVATILAPRKGNFETLKDTWRGIGRLSLALLDGEFMAINSYKGMLSLNREELRKQVMLKKRTPADLEWTFDKKQNTVGLNITKEQDAAIKKDRNDKVAHKNANQVIVKAEDIEKLAFGLYKKKHKTIEEKIISLCLGSACRKIEILQPKISTFALDPKNNAKFIQNGVAKSKSKKDKLDAVNKVWNDDDEDDVSVSKRVVHKYSLGMTPPEFLELLDEVRAHVAKLGDLDTVSNKKLGNRYNSRLNKTIKALFKEYGMPSDLDAKSHMLRKLHSNYVHKTMSPSGQSLASFLTTYLGHSSEGISQAVSHYTVVHIQTDAVLEEKSAAELLQNKRRVADSAVEIAELKKKVDDLTNGAPIERVACIESGENSITQSTLDKFKLLDELKEAGISGYAALNKKGFSNYIISKWGRSKTVEPAGVKTRSKKKKEAEIKPTKKTGHTVAQAGKYLLEKHGKVSSRLFAELQFSSLASRKEIAVWRKENSV